jgi:uncharacterized membrane protein YdjX (TVP38/TMEM64 family)
MFDWDWIRNLGNLGPFAFGAAYAVLVVLLVPAGPLTIAAGAAFGLARGLAISSVASTTGAVIAFLASRYLLRERVRKWLGRKPAFSRIDAASSRHGAKLVALARLSPVLPYNVLNYAFGATRVRLLPYALVSWIAMLPGTFLYVAAGALAMDVGAGGTTLGRAGLALKVAGVVATAVLVWWMARIARHGLDGEGVER